MEYTVQDSELAVDGETVSFGVPIYQDIKYDGFVVVRLKVTRTDHPDKLRNVVAVGADGSIRWRIPEQPPTQPRPYTKIFTKGGDDLWTNNSSGYLFRVDPETGELLNREFVK